MMRRFVFKQLQQLLQTSMPFIPLCCLIHQVRTYNFTKELLLEIMKKEIPHKVLVSLLPHELHATLLWLLLVELYIRQAFILLCFVFLKKKAN